uniref:Uncharacterized protein n=1 Tax=Rhizophora mucronata TaxID=61149 RepID=A0A2P2PPH0_RHIMU
MYLWEVLHHLGSHNNSVHAYQVGPKGSPNALPSLHKLTHKEVQGGQFFHLP